MKKLIRLTEGDLHRIVEGSVRRALNELDWKTYMNAAKKSYDRWKNDNDDDEAADRADDFTYAAKDSFMKKHNIDKRPDRARFKANFAYPSYDDNDYEPKVTGDLTDWYTQDAERSWPNRRQSFVNYHSDPDIRRGVKFDDEWPRKGQDGFDVPTTRTTLNNRDYADSEDFLGNAYNDINHYNTGKSRYVKGKGWTN